jgi:uncharacterized RDD family membrane protein YckC
MSMPERPERAGWYDDPDNSEQLRYFDGVVWTDHVTPRRTRWDAPAQQAQGAPAGGYPYAGGQLPGHAPGGLPQGPPPTGWPSAPTVGAPVVAGPAIDGVPLASYVSRVLAYILDALIVGFLSTIAGGYFLFKAISPMLDTVTKAVESGDTQAAVKAYSNALDNMDPTWLAAFVAVQLVVQLIYTIFFLTRWSATPGKLALGISVRRVDRAGVVDFATASRRAGFVAILSALGSVPFLGLLASLTAIADLLWPLGDKRRQTLHDKVAATVVVQGRQERSVPHAAPQDQSALR